MELARRSFSEGGRKRERTTLVGDAKHLRVRGLCPHL